MFVLKFGVLYTLFSPNKCTFLFMFMHYDNENIEDRITDLETEVQNL